MMPRRRRLSARRPFRVPRRDADLRALLARLKAKAYEQGADGEAPKVPEAQRVDAHTRRT